MKKLVYLLCILATATIYSVSCQKQPVPENETGKLVTVTFVAQAPATKTAASLGDGTVSYSWTEGDEERISLFAVTKDSDNKDVLSKIDADASVDNDIMTITAQVETGTKVRAILASEFTKSNNPRLLATQSPEADNFDPTADILISEDKTINETSGESDLLLAFTRKVVANKMSLHGIDVNDKVSSVEITSNKNLAGLWAFSSSSYSGESKKITLTYSNSIVTESSSLVEGGVFDVYFVAIPDNEETINVRVTTDKKIYEKDLSKTISFELGNFNTFGVDLSNSGQIISSGVEYTLVESNDDIYEGATYLLVGGDTYAMGAQKTSNRDAVAVTDKDGVITIDNSIEAYPVVIENTTGGFLLYDTKNQGYLYTSSTTANNLKNQTEAGEYAVWTISISDGVASISNVKNQNRGQIRFNPNNNSPMFAAYATTATVGSADLALYVDLSTCVAHPRIVVSPSAIENVSYSGVEDATNITFELKDLSGKVTASCDGTVVTEASVVGNTVKYSVSANEGEARDGWIKVSVGEVFAEVSVSQAAAPTLDFTTIAELNTLAAGLENNETATFNGKLTGAIVSYKPDAKNAIIKDGAGSILVFNNDGHGLLQGQTFTGDLEVTVKMYFTTIEITALDADFIGAGSVVDPETVTLSDLVGNFSTYQNAYVKVENLKVDSRDGKNISVSNGEKTYLVYDNAGTSPAAVGDVITAVGTVADHNGTNQIKVWASDNITVTTSAPKAITFSQPAAGGSFTVSVGGSNISSGATVASGSVVTLTATAASGYSFGGWTVTGATVANATATSTTFTMGDSAVSISASFNNVNGTTYTKVTTEPSDWSGTYVIVYEESETSGLVCLAGTDAYQNSTTAKIASGVITSNDLSNYEVEIASYSTGYSIKALGGANANKYIEGKGNSNGTNFLSAANKVTTLALSGGVVTITNNTDLFVYNSTTGTKGERWRFYKSGTAAGNAYKKPALYKKN